MSVIESFTKGSGKKVSTRAAKEAADPDWNPEPEDEDAPRSKRKRDQVELAEKPAKAAKEPKAAKAAKAAAAAAGGGKAAGYAALEDEAEGAAPYVLVMDREPRAACDDRAQGLSVTLAAVAAGCAGCACLAHALVLI